MNNAIDVGGAGDDNFYSFFFLAGLINIRKKLINFSFFIIK